MGKSLIIPGADFSANAVQVETYWYNNDATIYVDELNMNFATGNYYSTQNIVDALKGKTIECIRIPKNSAAGQISLGVFPNILNESIEPVNEIQINIPFSENSQVIMLSEPLYVDINQLVCIRVDSPMGSIDKPKPLLYCNGASIHGSDFYTFNNLSELTRSETQYLLGIDFGYYM